jgi:putative acetyltransferase
MTTSTHTTLHIAPLNPLSDDAAVLLSASDSYHTALYPAESNHLTDASALCADNIVFLGAWDGDSLVATGAVKLLDHDVQYGEIKRVFVLPAARGMGISKQIMHALETCLLTRDIHVARLETGIHQPEALRLYERLGYRYRAPFGDYKLDPLSVFMEKTL